MRRRLPLVLAAALATALCAHDRPSAEVRVVLTGSPQQRVSAVIEMRAVDEAGGIWSPVATTVADDYALLLNPGGDRHGDGPPSIRMNPVTQIPEAVWSFRSGRMIEVVWSRFDGAAWTPPVALTGGGLSLDPRLWIDDKGNRRVAFWRRGLNVEPDALFVTALPDGEQQWWLPRRISLAGVATRHPDIRAYRSYGTFLVAEEQTAEGMAVVVFDLPAADGDIPPQRDSDPWGRQRILVAGDASETLEARLVARPGSGGVVPQIEWTEMEGASLRLGMIYYDTQSLTWSKPFFFSLP